MMLYSIGETFNGAFSVADLNSYDTNALISAVKYNRPESVELLLTHPKSESKIDVQVEDHQGRNIVEIAIFMDAPNVLSLLLSSDKIPNKIKASRYPFPINSLTKTVCDLKTATLLRQHHFWVSNQTHRRFDFISLCCAAITSIS